MSTADAIGFTWLGGWALCAIVVCGAAGWLWQAHREWLHVKGVADGPDMALFLVLAVVTAAVWPLAVLVAPFFAGGAVGSISARRQAREATKRAAERDALRRVRDVFDRSEPEWSLLDQALEEKAP